MSPARILVIEDDPAIRRGVVDALRVTGYAVEEAGDGARGLALARQPAIDLVLLDLLLPHKDGLDVLRDLRQTRPAVPVIVLTARGTEEDRVRGLKLGADDYVVKPFSARELLARVEAVLRRCGGRAEEVRRARLGKALVDFARREVCWPRQERVELSDTEATLLGFLLTHRQRAVCREELLGRLWGIVGPGVETRTVDMHVARLRQKLQGGDGPEAIVTVRAQGYMAGPEWRVLDGEGDDV